MVKESVTEAKRLELEDTTSHEGIQAVAGERKKKIERQIAYVNALVAEFRERFPESAWLYPVNDDLCTFKQIEQMDPEEKQMLIESLSKPL